MVSVATENFIKTVYKLEEGEGSGTRTGSIARALGITNAAATDMARKLSEKKLLDYEKYRELKLTDSGKKLALNIVRRHRLWETFLHQVLGLSLHEIHREAESLEHQTSDFLAEKISLFLGNPLTDPHGDPIPVKRGEIPEEDSILLSAAQPGNEYEIIRMTSSDKEYFDFCHSNRLGVGASVLVKKQYRKSRMTELEVGRTRLLLNAEIAGTLHVKKLNSPPGGKSPAANA